MKVSSSRPSCLRSTSLFLITLDHMKKLQNNTFVGNTGHFDNEVHLARSEGLDIKLQKFLSPSPLATV